MILASIGLGKIVSTVLTGAAAYLAACNIETIWARVLGIAYPSSKSSTAPEKKSPSSLTIED